MKLDKSDVLRATPVLNWDLQRCGVMYVEHMTQVAGRIDVIAMVHWQ